VNLRRVKIEWTNTDEVETVLDRKRIIIRLRHRKNMRKNMAIAITTYIQHVFPPTMSVVITDSLLLNAFNYLIARDIAKNDPYLVHEIKNVIESQCSGSELHRLYEILDKLDEIYSQNLVIRLLLPEIIDVTSSIYPRSPPDLVNEINDLIDFLYRLSRGQLSEPIFRGKYFRIAVVRVAVPEKILYSQMKPHLNFIDYAVNKQLVNTVCILAAGPYKPYWARKLAHEVARRYPMEIRVDDLYEARYRGGITYVYCAVLKRIKTSANPLRYDSSPL